MRVTPISAITDAITHLRDGVSAIQFLASHHCDNRVLVEFLKPRINNVLAIIDDCDIYQLQIKIPRAFDILDECHFYLSDRRNLQCPII